MKREKIEDKNKIRNFIVLYSQSNLILKKKKIYELKLKFESIMI